MHFMPKKIYEFQHILNRRIMPLKVISYESQCVSDTRMVLHQNY